MTNTIYVSGFIFISFSFGRIVIFDLVSFGTPLGLPSVQRSVVAFGSEERCGFWFRGVSWPSRRSLLMRFKRIVRISPNG